MKILNNIFLIKIGFVNTYLIEKDGDLVLIDAGLEGSGDKILEYIAKNNYRLEQLKSIIITHHHHDHVGGLKEIIKKISVEIASHLEEAPLIRESCGVNPTILLSNNSIYMGLRVIHTPGHTPGHLCILDEENGAIFSGDLFYEENGILKEIPYKYSKDPAMNRSSIKKLINYSFKHVLPSHGNPILEDGWEKILFLVKSFE